MLASIHDRVRHEQINYPTEPVRAYIDDIANNVRVGVHYTGGEFIINAMPGGDIVEIARINVYNREVTLNHDAEGVV